MRSKPWFIIFTVAIIALINVPVAVFAERIRPEDMEYKGAFRLPDDPGWEYSGYAMTYYPHGDPNGPNDGYPGSLFVIGHDHHQHVSEISIPAPVISSDKDPQKLPRAKALQPFADITGGAFGYLEIPRAGLAYLPKQGMQKTDKLHFCWGQHFQAGEPSHGWCELDLSNPKTAGPWLFGDHLNYVTNDYLFSIPNAWADAHTPGQYLATGRFRDGHWSGSGPSLFAYGPWNDGDPLPPKAKLKTITPLLLYGTQEPGAIEMTTSDSMKMEGFKEADEWSGGAWLTAGKKSAVILVGTKALGKCWYGFSNGVAFPINTDENTVYPEVPPWPHDSRGWWSEDTEAQIIFYDTDDFAAVAKGERKTYEPQPYASLDIDGYLFDPGFDPKRAKRFFVGAVSFDRARAILYVVERRADEERSLIHVWQVKP